MSYKTKREIFEQSNTWILDLTRQVLSYLDCYIKPTRLKIEDELGAFNDSDAYLAQIAIGMEPEPFGLAHIYQCIPYSNPKLFRQDLEGAVQRGWLKVVGDGSYQATDQGRQFHKRLRRDIRNVYNGLRPIPILQLERLDAILEEIIKRMRSAQNMDYKPAFEMDLKLAPTAPSRLQKIYCKLSHLMAFRDDAYVNAWMDQEVNSYVWEAFSYVYKGQAQTASELVEALASQRHYGEGTYAAALEELENRGWIIALDNDQYEPSAAGLKVLAEVARKMTQYFFEPWADLEEAKISRLKILMEALIRGLKAPQNKRWYGQTSIARNFGWRSAQWVRDKVR